MPAWLMFAFKKTANVTHVNINTTNEAQLTKPHGGKLCQLYLNLTQSWSTVDQTSWGESSLIVFESEPWLKHSCPNLVGGKFANCIWICTKYETQLAKPHGGKLCQLYVNLNHKCFPPNSWQFSCAVFLFATTPTALQKLKPMCMAHKLFS